jgi:rSAM/selenodomain-associated transferase 1
LTVDGILSTGDLPRFPCARILVFAKAPEPGVAKTRLIPALGAEGAAALHRDLLVDTLARLAPARVAPVELWCAPGPSHPLFKDLAGRFGVSLHAQQGGDLGARLFFAARDALTRAEAVVLVGCDCPGLGPAQVTEALVALLETPRQDAVLGPADDGGYVLLALRRAAPAVFLDVPWGGDQVAAVTRRRMAALAWRWRELESLPDVDRPEDLVWFGRRAGG